MIFNKDNVILEDNDLCLCGSGKKFAQCCTSRNFEYKTMGIDYTGRHVIYNYTEVTNSISSLLNFIDTRINSLRYITSLTRDDALRKLSRLYEKLDKALAPIQSVSTCRHGCCYCCYGWIISTSHLEFELVKDYLKTHFSEDNQKKLQEKINNNYSILSSLVSFGGGFSDDQIAAFSKLYIPCAFLNKDNRCDIYEVRPFVCRRYLVFNNPVDCTNRFGKDFRYSSPYLDLVSESISRLNTLYNSEGASFKHILTWFIQ